MKTSIWMGGVVALCLAAALAAKDQPFDPAKHAPRKEVAPERLDAAAQQSLLQRRIGTGMLGVGGSFNSYASYLYAAPRLVVHTDEPEIGKARLHNVFPKDYRPTVAELFDAMANQMNATWAYDEARAMWVFSSGAVPLPFRVKLADGWRSEARGGYLFCQPPGAEVGMDIYFVHSFSAEDSALGELAARSRDHAALGFARTFNRDLTATDLQSVQLGSHDTRFFTAPTPRLGVTWRQWSIAEHGRQIVVVSALDDAKRDQLLPQIEAMITSLEIVPAPPAAATPPTP